MHKTKKPAETTKATFTAGELKQLPGAELAAVCGGTSTTPSRQKILL